MKLLRRKTLHSSQIWQKIIRLWNFKTERDEGEKLVVDPIAGLGLFKTVTQVGKAIAEIAKSIGDHKVKQELNDIYDNLMSLKQDIAGLEDENRELREKLRFKSDDFEFLNPFWYEPKHPDRPLCPTCFSKERVSPVSELRRNGTRQFRRCLVCQAMFY